MTPEEVIAHALLHYVDPPGRTLWGSERSDHKAQFVLSALKAAGLVVVPKEPTNTMAEIGVDARWQSAVRDADSVREIYRAMIRAATSLDAPLAADPVPHG